MAEDVLFDGADETEKFEETKDSGKGNRPVFKGPRDIAAAWIEQGKDGTWYLSVQIDPPFLEKQNFLLFPTEEKQMRKYFQKLGTGISEK